MKKISLRGFTLIELLVVITIIGILAGIAIPAIGAVLKAAKRTEAKVFMGSLQTAMVNYQTEYNVYPSLFPTAGVISNAADWQTFYKVFVVPSKLVAADTDNSRRIVFMDQVQSKYLNDPANPLNAGNYFNDPWGKPYVMWVDNDYDNILKALPDVQAGTTATKDMPGSVAVYTFGENGVHDKKSLGTWK